MGHDGRGLGVKPCCFVSFLILATWDFDVAVGSKYFEFQIFDREHGEAFWRICGRQTVWKEAGSAGVSPYDLPSQHRIITWTNRNYRYLEGGNTLACHRNGSRIDGN